MEEEVWQLQRLETFAAAYIKHEILYTKPPVYLKGYAAHKVQQHNQLRKEFALGRMAGALGLPNNHALRERCREFRFQLLCYIRGRVRACALRGDHPENALADAPSNVSKLAKRLNFLRVAIQAELSHNGSPVQRWAVDALMRELAGAARVCCENSGAEPEALTQEALAAACTAVIRGTKPASCHLWLRLCNLRKQQLMKLSLGGDRNRVLWPGERFAHADWPLLDVLLLHSADDTLPLVTELLLYWRDSLCALVLLVELLAAARSPRPSCPPRRLPPCPRRVAIWRSVHRSYTVTGRLASVVLLQRRWYQLLRMARAEPRPHHPLLALVATSFPRVMKKEVCSWLSLVKAGLVITDEQIAVATASDEVSLAVDFSELENCKSTKDIFLYIENKIQLNHSMHNYSTFWKQMDASTDTADSSYLSDSEPGGDDANVADNIDMANNDTNVANSIAKPNNDTNVADSIIMASHDTNEGDSIDMARHDTNVANSIDMGSHGTNVVNSIDKPNNDTNVADCIDMAYHDANVAASIDKPNSDTKIAKSIDKPNSDTKVAESIHMANHHTNVADSIDMANNDTEAEAGKFTDDEELHSAPRENDTIVIDSDNDTTDEVIKDEQVKTTDKLTESSKTYIEIEIDTSRIVDYISDVLTEVEGLNTLDDLEKNVKDVDCLKTFKIMRAPENFIKYVDGNEVAHQINILRTGRLIFSKPCATLDPQMLSLPRVRLKRIDETRAWRKHARDGRIDVKRSGMLLTYKHNSRLEGNVCVPELLDPEAAYISDSTDNEEETEKNYTYDGKSRNPDLNPKLKRLMSKFWKKQNNRRLMKLCRPAVVKLSRLREEDVRSQDSCSQSGGRVVKKVELADIDEVRRINKSILTAQVEPIYVSNCSKAVSEERAEELEREARELAGTLLTAQVERVHGEFKKLFIMTADFIQYLINMSIYDDETDDEDAKLKNYSGRYDRWLKAKQMTAAPAPAPARSKTRAPAPASVPVSKTKRKAVPQGLEQQKIISNKYFEIGTKTVESKQDDDLDNLLTCTIIKKPTAEGDNTLETDVATQPFFVSSMEELVATDCQSIPVITEVCSLAPNGAPGNSLTTNTMSNLSLDVTNNFPNNSTKNLLNNSTKNLPNKSTKNLLNNSTKNLPNNSTNNLLNTSTNISANNSTDNLLNNLNRNSTSNLRINLTNNLTTALPTISSNNSPNISVSNLMAVITTISTTNSTNNVMVDLTNNSSTSSGTGLKINSSNISKTDLIKKSTKNSTITFANNSSTNLNSNTTANPSNSSSTNLSTNLTNDSMTNLRNGVTMNLANSSRTNLKTGLTTNSTNNVKAGMTTNSATNVTIDLTNDSTNDSVTISKTDTTKKPTNNLMINSSNNVTSNLGNSVTINSAKNSMTIITTDLTNDTTDDSTHNMRIDLTHSPVSLRTRAMSNLSNNSRNASKMNSTNNSMTILKTGPATNSLNSSTNNPRTNMTNSSIDVRIDLTTECTNSSSNILKTDMTKSLTNNLTTNARAGPTYKPANNLITSTSVEAPTPVCTDLIDDAVRKLNYSLSHNKRVKSCCKPPVQQTPMAGDVQQLPGGAVCTKDHDGPVVTVPVGSNLRKFMANKKNDLSQTSKATLPKRYERFADPSNDLASLTPVLVKDAFTSTITLAPATFVNTLTSTFNAAPAQPALNPQPVPPVPPAHPAAMPAPPASGVMPTLPKLAPAPPRLTVIGNPVNHMVSAIAITSPIAASSPQLLPTLTITPRISASNVSQFAPTIEMVSQASMRLVPTLTVTTVPAFSMATPVTVDNTQMPTVAMTGTMTNMQMPTVAMTGTMTNMQMPTVAMTGTMTNMQMPTVAMNGTMTYAQMPMVAMTETVTNVQMPMASITKTVANAQMPMVSITKTVTNAQMPKVAMTRPVTVSNVKMPTVAITKTVSNAQMPKVAKTKPVTINNVQMPTVEMMNPVTLTNAQIPTVAMTNPLTVTNTQIPTVTMTNPPTVTNTQIPTVARTTPVIVTNPQMPTVAMPSLLTVTNSQMPTVAMTNPLTVTNSQMPTVAMSSPLTVTNPQIPTVAMPSPLTVINSQMPTVAMTNPLTVTNSQIPTVAMPSPLTVINPQIPTVATAGPVTVTNAQFLPALTPLSHGLMPASASINVVGNNKPENEVILEVDRNAVKWTEPGRVVPPTALSFNCCITAKDYIDKFGQRDFIIVKLDSSRPLWTVAEEYLVLAEKILPCKSPSYWTLGPPAKCMQLIWPKNRTPDDASNLNQPATSTIVIANVVGNYQPGNRVQKSNLVEPICVDNVIVNLSDSESDDVQVVTKRPPMLKVKSFAKCKRSERNLLERDAAGHPDVLEQHDRYYKKLSDDPVCYALMLTVVTSTDECDGLLRERAALHVWDRRTGAVCALDVSAPSLDQLPERMGGALLVRHSDAAFLKDMACKFQELNASNALVRENQVYVFAPKTGTLLVAPPGNLIFAEKIDGLVQNSMVI